MIFTYTIEQDELLKSFLYRHDFSKKTISAIKQDGALLVNNAHATVRYQLRPGDCLEVRLPRELPSPNLIPFEKPLNILFEDDFILIVSKAPMQNSAPSREHPHESLVEQALNHMNNQNETGIPHIVTRLDRNTSGIVVFAKSRHIHHLLSETPMHKNYVCLCEGETPLEGDIIKPIMRHPDSIIERMVHPDGKYAHTSFRRLGFKCDVSLCDVRIHTGRTHQIRVHFKAIGHPLLGDGLYGGQTDQFQYHMLHAERILFTHPITLEKLDIVDQFSDIRNRFNAL